MRGQHHIIDLFAGPGGLGEGFSAFRDQSGYSPFRIKLSIEKEQSAFETLRLRSFLRCFPEFPPEYYQFLNEGGNEPDWAAAYPNEWRIACAEALHLELGSRRAKQILNVALHDLKQQPGEIIVIGGPPCQAYSLVGRARNKGVWAYDPREDRRHFLYREYIAVLRRLFPAAFVMENVKGILSSSIDGTRLFDRIISDLRCAGGNRNSYRIFALARSSAGVLTLVDADNPKAFVVESEKLGVPQSRHRVIIVGLRSDISVCPNAGEPSMPLKPVTLQEVLCGLPPLRSQLSTDDGENAWHAELRSNLRRIIRLELRSKRYTDISDYAALLLRDLPDKPIFPTRRALLRSNIKIRALRAWIHDEKLQCAANHEPRKHMRSDLGRYLFAAIFAKVRNRSPKAVDFPRGFTAAHANWDSGDFPDRFRVQLEDQPSTTITSHISKDGHYYIHPDPLQCRSLTVREAARLQTFPDNYFFKGSRTRQYIQVGNAVPPFLALQIAEAIHRALSRASKANIEQRSELTRILEPTMVE